MPLSRKYLLGLSPSGFHRLSYTEWGDARSPHVVVCVHGLTRNARDFDSLAQALQSRCRVICPDVVGRGQSAWLARKEDYAYPQYLADMTALIARATEHLQPDARIDWVGTSMGGLIGMLLAAQPGHPIRRMVLNDIGPFVPKAALARIALYVGNAPRFASLDEAERYVRIVSAPFGPLTGAQWRHLTEHNMRREADGSFVMSYDPGIATALATQRLQDIDLWALWERIDCPVLAVRGMESDVLSPATAQEMTRRGPRARLIELAGIGHAPALMAEDQIEAVRDFLLAPDR
ncbi:MAG: alpha/beta fold hydrolase [Betaproteobacteria bacterium]|nr:alpha/beta fold hydrolase [Betaproteobacteria bacterium]